MTTPPHPYLRALSEKIKIRMVLSQNQSCYEKKMSVDGMIVDCLKVVSLYLLGIPTTIYCHLFSHSSDNGFFGFSPRIQRGKI